MSKILKDQTIPKQLRMRIYNATVLNILLYGCESWALKTEDYRRIEACHHRFLRSILNITMRDVQECRIRNELVREELDNCPTAKQHIESRRAKWLEKLSRMPETRNPRKILVAWTPNPRPAGRPFQTINRAYANTLSETLGLSTNLKEWMPIAQNREKWEQLVEEKTGIKYSKTKKPGNQKTGTNTRYEDTGHRL